ncbi:pentapeptide repeat-containing protein [Rhodococcus rhodochrous]|uniref:pentapeptide repeat-containing protein n=1 Tax=Rhodococcus rhodochrous TaxID=1829 RepID=UPI001E5F0F9B|nr:pentapeptide repeat-containing protein [Rhodococcus rhodochrous]MCB8914111.1 pentapeptide repeat-containing protein [Rhodococcus rhodochrous]
MATVMAASLAIITTICLLVSALGDVPFNRAWDLAALPSAVILLAIALLASIVSSMQRPSAGRQRRYLRRRLELEPVQLHQMRSRTREALRLLAEDHSTLRRAGVYDLLAITDDWCHLARIVDRPGRALFEHERCLDLICGYLRANRRLSRWVPGTYIEAGDEREERELREELCLGLIAHLTSWESLGPFSVNLSGADLSGMRLRDSGLVGVVARASVLTETDLTGADLRGADLSESAATRARFSDADLGGADLTGIQANQAVINGANVTDARLCDAHLRGAQLLGTVFDRTDLSGADLRGAKLMRADLRTSVLDGANFDSADLTDARPPAVRGPDVPRGSVAPIASNKDNDRDFSGRLASSPDANNYETMRTPI